MKKGASRLKLWAHKRVRKNRKIKMCIIKYSFVLLDRKLDKWYTLAGPANICALRYANEIKLAQWNEQMKQIEKKNWPLWILLSSADQRRWNKQQQWWVAKTLCYREKMTRNWLCLTQHERIGLSKWARAIHNFQFHRWFTLAPVSLTCLYIVCS